MPAIEGPSHTGAYGVTFQIPLAKPASLLDNRKDVEHRPEATSASGRAKPVKPSGQSTVSYTQLLALNGNMNLPPSARVSSSVQSTSSSVGTQVWRGDDQPQPHRHRLPDLQTARKDPEGKLGVTRSKQSDELAGIGSQFEG
ncbi:hypothetical protein LTR53_007702 [Teratosphaeriaceae sp. CCFEE 6253]|nr:hypothetical protein LTR53_007702 [Teratosphaeriaceae sp. CCFEE 6253]